MTEKLDIASEACHLKSPNIKTRKHALKAIHDLNLRKSASK
ncbi:putative metal homeostasis protein [Leuconostoc citreum]